MGNTSSDVNDSLKAQADSGANVEMFKILNWMLNFEMLKIGGFLRSHFFEFVQIISFLRSLSIFKQYIY